MDYSPYLEIAKQRSSQDPAHDFLHVQRVLNNAILILSEIPADQEVVIPAILLHELFTYSKGDPRSRYSGDRCAELAMDILTEHKYPLVKLEKVLECIKFHSFSRGVIPDRIEGKIVQDADRLDSIGAIGVARCFASCAEMERPFYDLNDPFAQGRELDDIHYGLDHFYIKLLKLGENMHTAPAKSMAHKRTAFMLGFLQEFKNEII